MVVYLRCDPDARLDTGIEIKRRASSFNSSIARNRWRTDMRNAARICASRAPLHVAVDQSALLRTIGSISYNDVQVLNIIQVFKTIGKSFHLDKCWNGNESYD